MQKDVSLGGTLSTLRRWNSEGEGKKEKVERERVKRGEDTGRRRGERKGRHFLTHSSGVMGITACLLMLEFLLSLMKVSGRTQAKRDLTF